MTGLERLWNLLWNHGNQSVRIDNGSMDRLIRFNSNLPNIAISQNKGYRSAALDPVDVIDPPGCLCWIGSAPDRGSGLEEVLDLVKPGF